MLIILLVLMIFLPGCPYLNAIAMLILSLSLLVGRLLSRLPFAHDDVMLTFAISGSK
jgi:hypothetical protein